MTPGTAQQEKALELANSIRIARANLKRELKPLSHAAACDQLAYIVSIETPPFLQSMMLGAFLEMAPSIGRVKSIQITTRIGRSAGAGWVRPLGELTQRQREVLANELRR